MNSKWQTGTLAFLSVFALIITITTPNMTAKRLKANYPKPLTFILTADRTYKVTTDIIGANCLLNRITDE